MFPLDLLSDPVGQRLTWTLLHFVWQALAVAIAVATLLYVWPTRRAQSRYLVYLSALIGMALCPLMTFMVIDTPVSATVSGRETEREVEGLLAPTPHVAPEPWPYLGPESTTTDTNIAGTETSVQDGQPRLDDVEAVPLEPARLEREDSARLLVPVAPERKPRFVLAEAADAWEEPEKVLSLLKAAAKQEPTIAGHEILEQDGAIFHTFSQLSEGQKFAFAVEMPDGPPVAGILEVRKVDRKNETIRLHRCSPFTVAAREVFSAANAAAEAMKSSRLVDSESEARRRFLAVERFARLPQSEQAKRLPEFYRNLDSRALNPMVEGILSSYPHDILKGHQKNDPFNGNTALWAGQLAGAADTLSPEQVADQLGGRLWLDVAARARALQMLRNHADATAALIGEDLASSDKAAVERAGMAIQSLELRSFSDELLDLWLADDELSEAAWRTLVMLGDPGIVKTLLE